MALTKNNAAPQAENKPTREQVEAAWTKLRKMIPDDDAVMIAEKLSRFTYPIFRKRVMDA